MQSSSLGRSGLLLRIVRKALIRPIVRRWRYEEVIEQLVGLRQLGRGVAINGPISFGNPPETSLGDDVCINGGFQCIGTGELVVGSHVHMGRDIRIITSNHRFEGASLLPYDAVDVRRGVVIGDVVWIGDAVLVVPGVHVGAGAVLGAGSVVTRDVPPLAVVGGAPAQVIRYRQAEDYRKLEERNAFLNWPREHDLVNGRKTQVPRGSRR